MSHGMSILREIMSPFAYLFIYMWGRRYQSVRPHVTCHEMSNNILNVKVNGIAKVSFGMVSMKFEAFELWKPKPMQ